MQLLIKYFGIIKKKIKMKTNKYIILLLTILAFTYACDDDGGDSAIDLIEVAIPNMTKIADSPTFIDLNKLNDGDPVSISFSAEVAQGTPSKTDVMGVYATTAGPVYTAVLDENAQLPSDYTFTADDLVAAFAELNSTADIKLGDVLSVSTRFTVSNDLVIDIVDADGSSGTGTNPQNNVLFNPVITYPVSCPTALEGNYTSTVIADGVGGLVISQEVIITQPSAGTYELNDGTSGLFGAGFFIGLNFTDVCGTISVLAPSIQYPGQVDYVDLGSSLDPVTGVITLDLAYAATSCCDIGGLTYTLQLTPN